MTKYIARALVICVLALLIASAFLFAMTSLPDGDNALRLLGHGAWVEDLRSMSRDLDPRLPFLPRYLIWLNRAARYARQRAGSSITTDRPAI